jgi:hypothetical protein
VERRTLIGGAVIVLVVGAIAGFGLRGVLAPPRTRDAARKAPETKPAPTGSPTIPYDGPMTKRDCALALLKKGSILVGLDARRPGVVVPSEVQSQAHLVLQYGYDLVVPIPDLDVGDAGISATLSFHRTPAKTFVPWSAVFAVYDESKQGCVYESDAPAEVWSAKPK